MVVVVMMATAIMIAVTMVTVVMMQMVAAAEHKASSKGYNKQFEKVHIHDIGDRRLRLFMNQAHFSLRFI